jgi:serine/threonine protein phosphatase PrpC
MDDQSLGDARESSAVCPACHAPVFAENNFCEACGHRICAAATAARPPAGQAPAGGTVAGACTGCGATTIDVDGYCEQCGLRQPGERDHMELELTVPEGGVIAAGVTDKGHRHSKNEDAMALAAVPGGAAVVVCDGVSSSPRPEDASRVAAKTGVSVLVRELESGADAETATREAVSQAARAVTALAASEHEAPACTYVSALVRAGSAVVGWVGDSRAYWLPTAPPAGLTAPPAGLTAPPTGLTGPPTGAAADQPAHRAIDRSPDQTADQNPDQNPGHDFDRTADQSPGRPAGSGDGVRLTEDDSWAGQMVALGALSEAQAQGHRNAHVLVGWLGADADAVEAHVRTFRPPGPGVLVVCSDGLWNYLPEASAIAGALAETLPGPPSGVSAATARPLAAARSLVGIALDSGGRDNITVVVIPFCPAAPAGPVETPAQPTTEPTE